MPKRVLCEPLEQRRLLSDATQIGDALYFTATSDIGVSLMRSNLDGSNRAELEFWNRGNYPSMSSSPTGLYAYHDSLYFFAGDPSAAYSAREPWISDGTPQGTYMVRDLHGGLQGSNPRDYIAINDHLLFVATDNSPHDYLYVTDGTWDGTVAISPNGSYDYQGGISNAWPENGLMYFEVFNYTHNQVERWQSDGTKAGTRQADPGAMVVNNQLRIFGSNGDDQINVHINYYGAALLSVNGIQSTVSDDFTGIAIYGMQGNDQVDVDPLVPFPTTIAGNEGDDSLVGGSGSDSINGGDGDDLITGSSMLPVTGKDTLSGWSGNDTIIGTTGSETILGGSGDDSIDGGGGNDTVLPDAFDVPPPPAPAPAPTLSKGVFSIIGTDGDDTILIRRRASHNKMLEAVVNGVPRSFRITSVSKVDISTGDGNDKISFDSSVAAPTYGVYIRAGDGADTVYGSLGADRISGGDGPDLIDASGGRDTLYGDAGSDTLRGGLGNDVIYSGLGADSVNGGDGRDRIIATVGLDDLEDDAADVIVNIPEQPVTT